MLGSPLSVRPASAVPLMASAVPDPQPDAEPDGSDENTPDLSGMTKTQLLETALELGIKGVSSRNTKAEIIKAITAAK